MTDEDKLAPQFEVKTESRKSLGIDEIKNEARDTLEKERVFGSGERGEPRRPGIEVKPSRSAASAEPAGGHQRIGPRIGSPTNSSIERSRNQARMEFSVGTRRARNVSSQARTALLVETPVLFPLCTDLPCGARSADAIARITRDRPTPRGGCPRSLPDSPRR